MTFTPKTLLLILSIGLSLKLVMSGIELNEKWDAKVNFQKSINYKVSDAQNHWRELEGFRTSWSEHFISEEKIENSRLNILKMLNLNTYGLSAIKDRITDTETTSISYKGENIGLSRTCISNTSTGFSVTANTLPQLLQGLNSLEMQQGLEFSDVVLLNRQGVPQAYIRDLCLLLKTGGSDSE